MSKIEKITSMASLAGGLIVGGSFFINSFFYTVDAGTFI